MRRLLPVLLLVAVTSPTAFGCGSDRSGSEGSSAPGSVPFSDQRFPDVLDAVVTPAGDTFTVAATISSPYDSDARYADAFRVLDPEGNQLGGRELTHEHGDEQPFTRTATNVSIPPGVTIVTVQGRDLANGWGGATVAVAVPGR